MIKPLNAHPFHDQAPGLSQIAVLGSRLEFLDRVSRQLKSARKRRRRSGRRAILCCYCTQTVVDHRSRGAQLFAFIAGQAGAIYLQHFGERRLGEVTARLSDQLALRARKSSRGHKECYCYNSTIV